ncbi:MAG: DinB family protein [Anaerolineae bacterium]|nr:DinB family protein [Anaerolineae bacterium]
MKRDEAIHQLRASRKEFQDTINGLSEEDLKRAKAVDKWALKELMGIIAAWDEELVRVLQTFTMPGESQYTYTISERNNFAAWNEEQIAARRERSLSQVMSEFEIARRDLIQVVEGLTDPVLNRRRMTSWGKPATGFELVAMQIERDRLYAEQVQSYRKKIERWARARHKLTEKRKTKK